MNFSQALIAIMWSMIVREAPGYKAEDRSEKAKAYYNDVVMMADVDRQVTEKGVLVDPEIDRVILGSIRFYESRYRANPPDGDCRPNGAYGRSCPAKGPMQIVFDNRKFLSLWPETKAFGINVDRMTVEQFKDPKVNATIGYAILTHWKTECKSPLPGSWIAAYGAGKCLKGLGYEGKRRCKTITGIMRALEKKAAEPGAEFAFKTPEGWRCGHES